MTDIARGDPPQFVREPRFPYSALRVLLARWRKGKPQFISRHVLKHSWGGADRGRCVRCRLERSRCYRRRANGQWGRAIPNAPVCVVETRAWWERRRILQKEGKM